MHEVGRQSLAGSTSSEWQLFGHSLEAGLYPAYRLVATSKFHQRLGQGPAAMLMLRWGGEWHKRCPEVEFLLDFRAVHLRGQLLT